MKITKQKTWLVLEFLMGGYLIVSSCLEPGRQGAGSRITFTNYPFQSPKLIESAAFKPVTGLINSH